VTLKINPPGLRTPSGASLNLMILTERFALLQVRVNNCEYQASNSALNKKLAKADAAASALRGMGLLS